MSRVTQHQVSPLAIEGFGINGASWSRIAGAGAGTIAVPGMTSDARILFAFAAVGAGTAVTDVIAVVITGQATDQITTSTDTTGAAILIAWIDTDS